MKRCPECRRDYYDDSLLYCLEDGSALVQGAVPVTDEIQTAILNETLAAATRAQIHSTDATANLPSVGASAPKRSGKRLLLIPIAFIVIALGAAFGYRYFAVTKQIESIAVMPFVNESGNADVEYLSDGMTETLISSLSQLPNLNVKGRSSVFRYKGKDMDTKTLGKELGVAKELGVEAILNGRLVEKGDQLTLNVELIDAATENVLWGNRYERQISDLVKLQSDVARDVSGRLKSKLLGSEEAKVTKTYAADPKALELYLKGRYYSRQFTLDGFHKGMEAFTQAIVIDPHYALAYAGLADAYFYASTIHLLPTEALRKSGEYARKAPEADDSLAAAHHSIANIKANYEKDFPGAKREFDHSLELDPRDGSNLFDYSHLMAVIGESDKGIALARRAKEIDPQDAYSSSVLAQDFVLSGRYDEAIEESRTTVRLDNKNWWGYQRLGIASSEKAMHSEAIAALETAAKLDESPLIRGALAYALARGGRRADAKRIIDDLIVLSKSKFVSESSIAMGFAALGDKENAFEWLNKSYESHDEAIFWLKMHPGFASLRDEPRYRDLIRKLNLEG